jgi:hypothetical protein
MSVSRVWRKVKDDRDAWIGTSAWLFHSLVLPSSPALAVHGLAAARSCPGACEADDRDDAHSKLFHLARRDLLRM